MKAWSVEVGVVLRGVWAVSEDACLWKLDKKEEGGETGCCEECKYIRLGLCLLLLMRMPAAILALLGARLFVAVDATSPVPTAFSYLFVLLFVPGHAHGVETFTCKIHHKQGA